MAMEPNTLELPADQMRAFCERWKVMEIAVFGSALREDFSPDSDLDILVEFSSEADWGLLDHVEMQWELQEILGREVDLVTRAALERSHNWIRKQAILGTARVLDLREGA